jgi:hypothetical protein
MNRFCLLICLLTAVEAQATTWYATASSVNINTANLWVPTSTGTCTGSGTPLVWGNQANGDIFDANGCTALAINVDPGSVSVHVTLQTNASTGGGFTLATADLGTMGTLHAHITAGTTTAVTITGSTGCGTISGNLTGGNTASARAVSDGHSVCTLAIVGNLTGGSNTSTAALYTTSTGPVTITGNATPGSASGGYGLYTTGSAAIAMTGNCVGSDTVIAQACNIGGGTFTLTGKLIFGKKGAAIGMGGGTFYFTPAATDYFVAAKDSSYVLGTIDSHATELPTNPGESNVKSGVTYGSFTGTYSAAGGTGRIMHQ